MSDYEYGRRPGKESVSDYVAKPLVLRKVPKPVFKYVESVFDEEALLIKQELNDEDSVSNSVIVNEKSTVKRPVIVNSVHNQTAHSKIAVNKAVTESFKGTVKRKPKIVTFVTVVKIVEADAAVKGDPTATIECAVNIDDTKSKNRNRKINRAKNGDYDKSAPRKLCNILYFTIFNHLQMIKENLWSFIFLAQKVDPSES